jgi:hypothetical protein
MTMQTEIQTEIQTYLMQHFAQYSKAHDEQGTAGIERFSALLAMLSKEQLAHIEMHSEWEQCSGASDASVKDLENSITQLRLSLENHHSKHQTLLNNQQYLIDLWQQREQQMKNLSAQVEQFSLLLQASLPQT